jgi:hypothetical protein
MVALKNVFTELQDYIYTMNSLRSIKNDAVQ